MHRCRFILVRKVRPPFQLPVRKVRPGNAGALTKTGATQKVATTRIPKKKRTSNARASASCSSFLKNFSAFQSVLEAPLAFGVDPLPPCSVAIGCVITLCVSTLIDGRDPNVPARRNWALRRNLFRVPHAVSEGLRPRNCRNICASDASCAVTL
jgi:hypothetical protein